MFKLQILTKCFCTSFGSTQKRKIDDTFSLYQEKIILCLTLGQVFLVLSDYSFQIIKKEIFLNYLTKLIFYTLLLLSISFKLFAIRLH